MYCVTCICTASTAGAAHLVVHLDDVTTLHLQHLRRVFVNDSLTIVQKSRTKFTKPFNLIIPGNPSLKAPVCQWVSEWVCVFGCSLTLPKRRTPASWNFEGWFSWDWEGFRLKNIWIRRTVSWNIACILAPFSTLAVNFILSSMNV